LSTHGIHQDAGDSNEEATVKKGGCINFVTKHSHTQSLKPKRDECSINLFEELRTIAW